jgi:outer membrane immunogenic protein
LGTLALSTLALVGAAGAADLRRPAPPPPAPPPPAPAAFNWSGCYIGGYVGGAWAENDPTFTDLGNSNFRSYSGGFVPGRLEASHSWTVGPDSSVIGGGTLGCNWQPVGSPFVIGIPTELRSSRLKPSRRLISSVTNFRR